jgi:hypothetical protein
MKWLFISFIFVSVSIFFSYYIFPSQTSLLTISFVVIALTPPLYKAVSKEEKIVAHAPRKSFLQKYGSILLVLLLISIGIFLSFSFWYNVLPSDSAYSMKCSTSLPCREAVFDLQSKYLETPRNLEIILGLMLICFILSLFLGAGAIFIITWDISSLVISATPGHLGFLAYMPQLLSFFLAGLSGAMLSFAIIKHEWRSHGLFSVLKDSFILFTIALILAILSYFLLYAP